MIAFQLKYELLETDRQVHPPRHDPARLMLVDALEHLYRHGTGQIILVGRLTTTRLLRFLQLTPLQKWYNRSINKELANL